MTSKKSPIYATTYQEWLCRLCSVWIKLIDNTDIIIIIIIIIM